MVTRPQGMASTTPVLRPHLPSSTPDQWVQHHRSPRPTPCKCGRKVAEGRCLLDHALIVPPGDVAVPVPPETWPFGVLHEEDRPSSFGPNLRPQQTADLAARPPSARRSEHFVDHRPDPRKWHSRPYVSRRSCSTDCIRRAQDGERPVPRPPVDGPYVELPMVNMARSGRRTSFLSQGVRRMNVCSIRSRSCG